VEEEEEEEKEQEGGGVLLQNSKSPSGILVGVKWSKSILWHLRSLPVSFGWGAVSGCVVG
jgi:hypothetical protein